MCGLRFKHTCVSFILAFLCVFSQPCKATCEDILIGFYCFFIALYASSCFSSTANQYKCLGFVNQGFFNFTSRRPQQLLEILNLGYSVMYNDVDMVWLADPFSYFKNKRDVYITDDMAVVLLSSLQLVTFAYS